MSVLDVNSNILKNKNNVDYVSLIREFEHKRLIDLKYLEDLNKPCIIRAVDYIRVSTAAQAAEDKVSLPEQELEIRNFIIKNKWEHYNSYGDEGISGKSIAKRGSFLEMMDDAKSGKFDVVVVWMTDRLGRNVEEMTQVRAELKKHKVQVVSVNDYIGVVDPRKFALQQDEGWKKIVSYLFDWKAEQDNVDRVKKFEAAKLGKARKGKIPVKVPYGFKKIIKFENGDRKKKIETDVVIEEKAIIVREVFDLYDKKSINMRKIAAILNFRKVLSPRGKKWGCSTIKYMLQNPTYTGLVRWGWRLAKSKASRARLQQGHQGIIEVGRHKKIIEPEQYKRVQEKMAIRKKLGGKAVSSKGLLTGILKCGRCGGGTYLSKWPNWLAYRKSEPERSKHKEVAVYLCSKYAHYGRSGCAKRYVIYAGKVEDIVIKKIKELSTSEEARSEFIKHMKKNNTKALKTKLAGIEKSLSNLEEKNNRLKLAYTSGAILLEEFTDDRKLCDDERRHLLEEKEQISILLIQEEKIAQQSEIALSTLADFDKSWSVAEFAERKQLLQLLLEKIVVKNEKVEIFFIKNAQNEF